MSAVGAKAALQLSTGERFEGRLIGAPLRSSGELVFTTGMVGYSEAITDPSYFGQILVFAYPLIGNYGIPRPEPRDGLLPRGFESDRARAAGVIVTIDSPEAYHWNSCQSLDAWMREQGIPGIAGLDTRHLVHLIRSGGGLKGRIEPQLPEGETPHAQRFGLKREDFFDPGAYVILPEVSRRETARVGRGSKRVALVDCGVKANIVRQLVAQGCEVTLLPWDADLTQVDCDAWVLSNGPGDPAKTGDLVPRISGLLKDARPILGICLGHQLLALASGAKTRRMPYGHRSHNQPVQLMGTRRGFLTSQNHGYVVEDESLGADWEAWFRNVNDGTIEGIRHRTRPFRSVQFHPEASGGPRDTAWVLEEFVGDI